MIRKQLYSFIFVLVGFGLSSCSLGDNERKMVREGNKAYQDSVFNEAEILYRKALDFNPTSFAANYNLANATYKQENFKSATKKYKRLLDSLETKEWRASANHNLGNSYLHTKKLDKAIEAYKESLRNNPDDKETKYNLIYAMKLKEQQQQQKQQNKDNQNKKQQNKDKKNEDKDKQNEQNKQNQDQQKDQKSKQDNKPKSGDNEKKPQPKPQKGDEEDEKDNKQDNSDGQKDNKKDDQKEGGKDKNEGDEPKDNPNKQDDKNRQNSQQEENPKENGEQQKIPVGISKEDAENILDAIAIEEKDAQEKVQKDKARKAGRVRTKKNW